MSLLTPYNSKSVAVIDNGIFPELARKLSESFGKVYYTSPWVSDYPSSYQTEIGEGSPEFERVNDIWEIIDDVDLFVFPDLHHGTLQNYLIWNGKRVFGARYGDELETCRSDAKEHFEDLGISQAPYQIVTGIEELRKYIQSRDKDKLWIKINRTRGDTETFCVEGYDLAKNRLDLLAADLGPVAERREFIVEDDLPDTIDLAIDTYSIDGEYPAAALLGTEQKDQGYVCAVKQWPEFPGKVTDIYNALAPTLKNYGYRNFLSLECRCRKSEVWLGDPCMRTGSPPFELELNMLKNLPDILWYGAKGEMVQPEYAAKYGFEVLVSSSWVDKNPLLVEFPEEYRDKIKFRYATEFPDGLWIMPQQAGGQFAAVVTHGDSLDDCFLEAQEIVARLKGTGIEAPLGSIDELKKNLEKLRSWDIVL